MYMVNIRTCGRTPSIFSDGGTLRDDGRTTWPKSTVKASHHIPKWPISNMVRSPGNVSTMVLRSYRRKGPSFPFSSATLMPCGVGLSPAPTQNLASEIIMDVHVRIQINWSWILFISIHILCVPCACMFLFFLPSNTIIVLCYLFFSTTKTTFHNRSLYLATDTLLRINIWKKHNILSLFIKCFTLETF